MKASPAGDGVVQHPHLHGGSHSCPGRGLLLRSAYGLRARDTSGDLDVGVIRLYKIYKKRGATYIRTYGRSINLSLTYKAPATSTFSAYKATSKEYKL